MRLPEDTDGIEAKGHRRLHACFGSQIAPPSPCAQEITGLWTGEMNLPKFTLGMRTRLSTTLHKMLECSSVRADDIVSRARSRQPECQDKKKYVC